MVSEPIEFFGPKSMAEERPLIGLQKKLQEKKHTRKLRRLKYSCEEVYERMDNGLCLFCDELDTPGHHDLKHKGIQIFIVDDDLASDDIEEFHQTKETVTNPEPIVETAKNLDSFMEPLVHDSVSQALDFVPDMLVADSHVTEGEELSQKSASGSGKKNAHQVFDQMPNEYQKDLTVIESSNKEVLSFSHKDGRIWEPGGLPTKMDHWDWFEKELKPYGESHKVATFLYSQMQVVKSNPAEFKTFDRKRGNETLSLDDERDDEHEQNQVIKLISSWTNRIWEPGGITLLSKMVCAFLLPFLTMNMDSRTICVTSRSIFVDDAANIALRRIVEDRFVPRMEEIYIESVKQNLEFAIDRGWIEFWINAHVFTLTNSGSKLSSSEYTKHTLILVYHLCSLSSSRLFVKTYASCIVALLMVCDAERLIQLDVPPIFSDLLCVMNRIRVRLKMVLLVEFLWLILFSSKMFKSSNVHQNKNQVDQKLSSYRKLLLRLLNPLHINKWRSRVLQRLSGLEFCLLPAKLDLRWPKGESKPHKKKSHQIETFEVLSSLEPSRRCRNDSLDVVDERMCNELVCEEDGDSIITMSAKFGGTYEDPRFELVCLKQSHDPVEVNLDNFESALTISSLRHTPTYQYRAPFNPYQNCNDQCDRESEEIEDDELQESLVVINGLSYNHGCVIGKTIGSICDSELGQDNSLDEEEFKGLKLEKLSKNERRLSIVCLLGIMGMSCWTQLSSLLKANEMSLRERDRWKRLEKQRTYNKAWKFKYIPSFTLSVLLQNEQHKLLQGRNIKCKMKKMEVLRRLKQLIFIEVQFHMKNNSEFNFQDNTRDAELETTLNDGDTFQKPLEDFYRACAYDFMALRVLELIKDKASRKKKLYKNWWFKYKLNTWLSETLHFWRKRKSEKLQRSSKHMICELVQNSWDMSTFAKSRTWLLCKMRIVYDLKSLRQFTRAGIKFHLKHKWRSKFGSSKLTRTWTRQKAWPRVLPRLHVRAFNLSFLRTRMFSTGEYCYRKYYLSHGSYLFSWFIQLLGLIISNFGI